MSDLDQLHAIGARYSDVQKLFSAFGRWVSKAIEEGALAGVTRLESVGDDVGDWFDLSVAGRRFRISCQLKPGTSYGLLTCYELEPFKREVSGGAIGQVQFDGKGEAGLESMLTALGAASIIASLVVPALIK